MKPLFIFGTRPEAVKLIPIIKKLPKSVVCVTGQHKEMLYQVLKVFNLRPRYDLCVMKTNQTLFDLTSRILFKLKVVLRKEKPDIVIVQGDTTTTFASALCAFYFKIPVGYVEAGLRSFNKYQPFPEEMNRKIVTQLADIYFAPTKRAKWNLIKEGIKENKIFITGNTAIDVLFMELRKIKTHKLKYENYFRRNFRLNFNKKLILVTAHRRENFGKGLERICYAIEEIALNEDVNIVYPVHLNPNISEPVRLILSELKNVFLLPPLGYDKFLFLMYKSYIILTDSGGIQEEAPSLGKPVLVMREVTERIEGINMSSSILVGTNQQKIVNWVKRFLHNKKLYSKMSKVKNPYGDGKAANRIVKILKRRNSWINY